MFLMNKYSAAERIRRALPYIEPVQFRRSLPDGLSIIVTECADPAVSLSTMKLIPHSLTPRLNLWHSEFVKVR